MHSVRDTAGAVLRSLLHDQPTTPAKVIFAWQMAAGATLSRATDCVWSDDGTLRVRARNAAWRREIKHARPILAERLRQFLGPDVVRRIVVEDSDSRHPVLERASASERVARTERGVGAPVSERVGGPAGAKPPGFKE